MILKAEVSKRFYSSKAKSSNIHYFALPIGTVKFWFLHQHSLNLRGRAGVTRRETIPRRYLYTVYSCTAVRSCTQLHTRVRSCTQLHTAAHSCTQVFTVVHSYTQLCTESTHTLTVVSSWKKSRMLLIVCFCFKENQTHAYNIKQHTINSGKACMVLV